MKGRDVVEHFRAEPAGYAHALDFGAGLMVTVMERVVGIKDAF
jgi:hypothetical protein